MVLVHADGNVGVLLNGGIDHLAQERLTGVFASTSGGLKNHGAVDLGCRLHDRLDLLHVVHVKGRQAVAMFCGMVE